MLEAMDILLEVACMNESQAEKLTLDMLAKLFEECKNFTSFIQLSSTLETTLNLLSRLLSIQCEYTKLSSLTRMKIEECFDFLLVCCGKENHTIPTQVSSFICECLKLASVFHAKFIEFTTNHMNSCISAKETECGFGESIEGSSAVLCHLLEQVFETNLFIAVECTPALCKVLCNVVDHSDGNVAYIRLFTVTVKRIFQQEKCYITDYVMLVYMHFCKLAKTVIENSVKSLSTSKTEKVDEPMSALCIQLLGAILDPFLCGIKKSTDSKQCFDVTTILSQAYIWCLLQRGIYHRSASIRKQTCCLLQLIIRFIEENSINLEICWPIGQCDEKHSCVASDGKVDNQNSCFVFVANGSGKTLQLYKQLISICKTLEENQIHIINPIVKKVEAIFCNICEGFLMPLSWILSIFLRMFTHENRRVQKEGVSSFLNMDFHEVDLTSEVIFLEFFSSGFMRVLQDDQLYYSWSECMNTDISNDISEKLVVFFKTCTQGLVAKTTFLQSLLHIITELMWSPVSLFHICHALYQIESCPAWKLDDLKKLRFIVLHSVKTHNKRLKETIQKLLLCCFIKFLDIADVNLTDIVQLLCVFVENKALVRGSDLWSEVSVWFAHKCQTIQQLSTGYSENTNFQTWITQWCKNYLCDKSNLTLDLFLDTMESTAQLIILCIILYADGVSLNKEDNAPAIYILDNVMMNVKSVLEKAVTHAYLSHNQVVCSVILFNRLLEIGQMSRTQESKDVLFHDIIIPRIMKLSNGLLECVCRKVPFHCDNSRVLDCYMNSVDKLLWMCNADTSQQSMVLRKKVQSYISTVADATISFSTRQDLQNQKNNGHAAVLLSMKSMIWCFQLEHKFAVKFDQKTLMKLSDFFSSLKVNYEKVKDNLPHENRDSAAMKQQFILSWWSCVAFGLKMDVISKSDDLCSSDTISMFSEHLQLTGVDGLIMMFQTAKVLLREVGNSSEDAAQSCAQCIETMWKETCDLMNSSLFRPLYKAFIEAAFQPQTITCPFVDIRNVLHKVLGSIKIASGKKPQLLIDAIEALRQHLHGRCSNRTDNSVCDSPVTKSRDRKHILNKILNQEQSLSTSSATVVNSDVYADFLVHCLTFAPAWTRDLVIMQQTLNCAESLSAKLSPTLTTGKVADVSIVAADLALQLSQSDRRFGEHCVELLLEYDKSLNKNNTRCHVNSQFHLTRQKLWQNMLLFLPFCKNDEGVDGIVKSVSDVLNQELQPSIRHSVEWTLTLLLLRVTSRESWIFNKLLDNTCKTHTFSSICSILTVALLIGVSYQYITTIEKQMTYFMDLVTVVMPWCMTQHFSVRLYGHAVLLRISKIFQSKGQQEKLHAQYPCLKTCFQFADNASGNVKKNWGRIKGSPMLFSLDPVADLSLETVLCSMPRLCHISSPHMADLERIFFTETWLPIKNEGSELRTMQPSAWLPQSAGKSEYNRSSDDAQQSPQQEANVQKKIVTSGIGHTAKQKRSGVVLVASLIDKAPNLGGLTRTCEVFGAECLVVNNKSCTEDALFQSLSVTAHKWMPIEEVKRWHLESYLARMKSNGYVLIGTEQTEQSVCLSDYAFPEKCVVLLGNEKEGIPAPLLRMLDVCVEIPQVGMIRSLNVHVSGAVTLWEYTKQQMLSEATKK